MSCGRRQRNGRWRCAWIALAAAGMWQLPASGGTVIMFVDDSAPGVNDGTGWADAFTDLQTALGLATAGDEIRVAQGVYRPAGRNGPVEATFTITSGVVVRGGYAGFDSKDPHAQEPAIFVTTLSGDLNGDDKKEFGNRDDNVHHVVTLSGGRDTILQGVRISGGNASQSMSANGQGGAIRVMPGSSPLVIDCTLEDNRAYQGAGVFGGSPRLERCIVRDNSGFLSPMASGIGAWLEGGELVECVFARNVKGHTGGAVFGDDLLIDHCEFIDNESIEDGGAIAMSNATTSCVIKHSRFVGNKASSFGGAVFMRGAAVEHCVFQGNQATGGSAIFNGYGAPESEGVIRDCVFENNGHAEGGTVANHAMLTIARSRFDMNGSITGAPSTHGGAVATMGTTRAVNCAFNRGFASRSGGAVEIEPGGMFLAANCVFAGNLSNEEGGAICNRGGTVELANCTVVGNRSNLGGGAPSGSVHATHSGVLSINNTIFGLNLSAGSDGEDAQIRVASGKIDINTSVVQGWTGLFGGTGNTGKDPEFLDADGPDNLFGTMDDDLHLGSGSAARDAGNNAAVPPDVLDMDRDDEVSEMLPVDFLGKRRIVNTVDIGAIEVQTCAADLAPLHTQGDGMVDVGDYSEVILHWGPCPDPCPGGGTCTGDIVPDCEVNIDDLTALVLSWGPC